MDNIRMMAEIKGTLAQVEGMQQAAMQEQLDRIEYTLEALQDYASRTTAEQFALQNGLKDVNLKRLGKIARHIAGDDAGSISHVRYGTVGFHPYSVWEQAYITYLHHTGAHLSVREYLNLVGYVEAAPSFRRLVEKQAQALAWACSVKVTVRTRGDRVSRKFPLDILEAALLELAA